MKVFFGYFSSHREPATVRNKFSKQPSIQAQRKSILLAKTENFLFPAATEAVAELSTTAKSKLADFEKISGQGDLSLSE